MTAALVDRGYSRSSILKTQRDIWHNYHPKSHSNKTKNSNKTTSYDLIPVVTYYDNHHSRLNRQWATIVRNNPIFKNTRIISAYKRHKNFKDLLTHPRLNYNDQEAAITTLAALL